MRMGLLALLAVMVSVAPPVVAAVWVWNRLDPALAGQVAEALQPQVPLLIVAVVLAAAAIALLVGWLYEAYGAAAARLAEEVGILATADPSRRLRGSGGAEIGQLAAAINRLAEERASTLDGIAAQVQAAQADSERERNLLAALVDDLAQGVIVCNAEGRMLLYNAQARDMFAGGAGAAGGFIGLGRRLAEVMEPGLVEHVRDRLASHGVQPGARATISLVTSTAGGRLIRARVRPVSPGHEAGAEQFAGFVLLAEDITRAAESAARQERGLQHLIERLRAGLGSIGVSSERLLGDATLASSVRSALANLAGEARELDGLVLSAQRDMGEILRAVQPLEDMRVADLLPAVQRRIESRIGLPSCVEGGAGEQPLWVRIDSFTFVQALSFLITRASEACDAREVRFRAHVQDEDAVLDIVWNGTALSTETALGWELEPMTLAGESSPLSVREVMERHAASLSYQRDRATTRSFFRIRLPRIEPLEPGESRSVGGEGGRPEFYDFDLFSRGAAANRLDDIRLGELACTVFDTETTGPDPSGGDEIIQIGAVRIVNGRLLRGERFEQLVDPGRPIHPESLRIHGITRDRLRGQPAIAEVLPRFHAFCADTILVAHNAAFDMRFLQLKEAATGLHFDQPILDTLLLSAVLHPNQESHRLEAMAERLGVGIVDRHDAFADAMITAQLFLRMIPLLEQRGIHTLGQARAASEETYHARIRY